MLLLLLVRNDIDIFPGFVEKILLPGEFLQGIFVGSQLLEFLVSLLDCILVIDLLAVLPSQLLEIPVPGNEVVGIKEQDPHQKHERGYEILVLQHLEDLPESRFLR